MVVIGAAANVAGGGWKTGTGANVLLERLGLYWCHRKVGVGDVEWEDCLCVVVDGRAQRTVNCAPQHLSVADTLSCTVYGLNIDVVLLGPESDGLTLETDQHALATAIDVQNETNPRPRNQMHRSCTSLRQHYVSDLALGPADGTRLADHPSNGMLAP